MKHLRLLFMLLCTATMFSLTSCNNSSDDKSATDEKTGDSTTATANTENAAPSTIVTTPENMMVVIHKVSNFAKWKASYDAHDSMRVAGGIHNYVVARGV